MPQIVGGSAKGRRFKLPPGDVRPATSRARQALFDYLANVVIDARVMDLYSGSGGLGFEALSRGAAEVWFIDHSARVVNTVKENADILGFTSQSNFVCKDVFRFLRSELCENLLPFDLVFASPPYKIAQPKDLLEAIAKSEIMINGGSVCLEFSKHTPSPEISNGVFDLDRRKILGETVIEVWDYNSSGFPLSRE